MNGQYFKKYRLQVFLILFLLVSFSVYMYYLDFFSGYYYVIKNGRDWVVDSSKYTLKDEFVLLDTKEDRAQFSVLGDSESLYFIAMLKRKDKIDYDSFDSSGLISNVTDVGSCVLKEVKLIKNNMPKYLLLERNFTFWVFQNSNVRDFQLFESVCKAFEITGFD